MLGLITARGGSKGIPRKNMQLVGGKPLIAWTIEAALAASSLGRVVMSTDDDEIAEVSRRYGAEVPFMRPDELSGDTSSHVDTVIHAVTWLEQEDQYCPEWICLLQPTSPFRSAEDIDGAARLAEASDANAVMAVRESHSHPYKVRKLGADGALGYWTEVPGGYLPRQKLEPAYMEAGSAYLVRRSTLIAERSLWPAPTLGYVVPAERALDVDEPWDLYLADLVLRDRQERDGKRETT